MLGAQTGPQVRRLTSRDESLWQEMQPSVAVLMDGGRTLGPAALIDDSGLFVASELVGKGTGFEAKFSSGATTHMTVLAHDGASGLVLMRAESWMPGQARPFHGPIEVEPIGGRLLAVLPTGPIRAEFVDSSKYGVLTHSHRLVPLSEFRFEAPAEALGGALVFCENGEIIGALTATLRRPDSGENSTQTAFTGGQRFPSLQSPTILGQSPNIGPSELTVAYTAGPSVVRRVIEGFRTADHTVSFPSLGVMCINTPGGGAMIQSVTPQSAADKAGLQAGDIIRDIGGSLIRDQVDFAKVMSRQEVGRRVPIRASRGRLLILRDVVIGRVVAREDD